MKLGDRIKNFFRTLGKSCYDMEFYRQVRTRPPARALTYAAAFFVVMSVVFGLLVVLPSLHSLRVVVHDGLHEELPDGTSLEIKDGQFSTTLQPGTEFNYEEVVFVVDPQLEGLEFPKSFEDRVGNYIGRDAIFIQYPIDEQDTVPFDDLPDFSVTKETAQKWLAKWGWPYVIIGTLLATLLRFLLVFLSALVFVVVAALGAMFAAKMSRIKLNYSQWLAVSLHAVTLPTIIDFTFSYFGLEMSLVYVVVFFMIIYAVLIDERTRPVGDGDGDQRPKDN